MVREATLTVTKTLRHVKHGSQTRIYALTSYFLKPLLIILRFHGGHVLGTVSRFLLLALACTALVNLVSWENLLIQRILSYSTASKIC